MRRVVRAEWIKATGLRSTAGALAGAAVAMVVLSALASLEAVASFDDMSPQRRDELQVTSRVLAGRLPGQLVVGVLGVLAVTSEYASGSVRASLAAVPRRLPVLWGKLVVVGTLVGVVMTLASLAAFLVGTSILAERWDFALGDPGVLRAVLGNGVTLGAVAALGVGLGFALRSTAAAVSALAFLLLILPFVGSVSPEASQYLPPGAIISLVTPRMEAHMLDPAPAAALLVLYVGSAVLLGARRLVRSDA